ncbi:MAG: hypothetical protein OHK0041_01210 [Anaerolineales bacterium]
MKKRRLPLDFRVAFLYLLFGGLWILLSDRLLAALVTDNSLLTQLQTYKGWAFVAVSALVIFLLLRRALRLREIAEANLRESEAKFKDAFESANVGKSITLPDGTISVNKAFADWLGYTREELINKTWQELTPPEEIEEVQTILATLLNGKKDSVRFTKRYIRKNGTFVWGDVNAVIRQDENGKSLYFITTIVDITDQKKVQEELRLSQERFSNAFYTSPAGITITRIADGTFVDANEAFCRMFEFSREEVIGHTSTELNMWSPEERRKLIDEQIRSGGLHNFELQARSKSGKVVYILFSSRPMELEGEPYHITTMIDITDRKRAEEELRLSRNRLAELSRQLIEAQETERRAIGRELHDQFGQMLTALKLTLDMAAQLSPELAEKKLTAAQKLVDDLIARTSRISLDLRPPMLDDLGLVPALLWHVHRFEEESGIRVNFAHYGIEERRFAPEIETTAYRAVQEALTNAARHAGATQISLQVRVRDGEMDIEIEDNGRGFDPREALAHNHGLGAMRERVNLAGGSFHVQSSQGEGARLSIRLPLRETAP